LPLQEILAYSMPRVALHRTGFLCLYPSLGPMSLLNLRDMRVLRDLRDLRDLRPI
jgi:hypothetical protein